MKRSPLKRGTSQLTRTPLARVGRKKQSKMARRHEVIRFVHQRDVTCRFPGAGPHITPGEADHWGPLDVHEIVPRSVWPDGDLEPDNCVLLCRHHHEWLDSHRDVARQIGLYSRSKP